MSERTLSDVEIRNIDEHIKTFNRRKKNRRTAINSCVDPIMEKRKGDRRGTFEETIERRQTNDPRLHKYN